MPPLDPFAVLPPEISLHILARNFPSDHDLVILWTSVRNVSRAWRALTDAYIRVKHLPTTHISYSLRALPLLADQPQGSVPRTTNYDVGPLGRNGLLTARFTFDGLSEGNPAVAVFSDKGADRELRGVMLAQVQRCLGAADDLPEWRYPLHITGIRHFANDTLLPGLQVDWVTLQLRCDWRALYTPLLYEEKLRLGLTKKWVNALTTETLPSLFPPPTDTPHRFPASEPAGGPAPASPASCPRSPCARRRCRTAAAGRGTTTRRAKRGSAG
jgi:hypothetical protein